MTGLLDNTTIDIKCPSCGRTHKERLGRLKNNALLHCPCGVQIEISGGNGSLAQGLKAIDKSATSLTAALKKLGK